jgi:hypothetical protein
MSAVAAAPQAPADQRTVLRQLTLIQAKRFATHPVYLIGLAILAYVAVTSPMGPDVWWIEGVTVSVSLFIGVPGLVVAYRLTRTEDEALALLPSAPTTGVTRTLALVGACLVPALTAASLMLLWVGLALAAEPGGSIPQPAPGLIEIAGGWGTVLAMLVDGMVVSCFGGPALGVATGRWLRFPGAGMLVTVVLVVSVAFVVGWSLQIPGAGETWPARVLAAASPLADWVLVDEDEVVRGVRPGSPLGHLLYAVSLSGLAVWAAVMRDAVGADRARWRRIGAGLTVVAVLAFLWALVG